MSQDKGLKNHRELKYLHKILNIRLPLNIGSPIYKAIDNANLMVKNELSLTMEC